MDILWIFRVYLGFWGNNRVGTADNSLWRHGAFSAWMRVVSCPPRVAFAGRRFLICIFCMRPHAKQHTHFPLSQRLEGFLWKLQPKSPSVDAEPNDLDTMQINSVLIWMLPEIGGVGREWGICTGPFLYTTPHPPHSPRPSVAGCHSPGLLAPCKTTHGPVAHFIVTFGKEPSLGESLGLSV